MRVHYYYIHLLQRNMNKKRPEMGHVVVEMPLVVEQPHKVARFETYMTIVVTDKAIGGGTEIV